MGIDAEVFVRIPRAVSAEAARSVEAALDAAKTLKYESVANFLISKGATPGVTEKKDEASAR